MGGSTEEQLSLIRRVVTVMRAADISAWLFGGWGLDARLGTITRAHGGGGQAAAVPLETGLEVSADGLGRRPRDMQAQSFL